MRPLTDFIDWKILPDSIYLLRGPNGIGKSSLIRSILSESHFTGGLQKIEGLKIVAHPQISAPMFALPLRLSDVSQWSDEPSSAADRLLGDLNLTRAWDSCSGGERQRVLLAALFSKAFFQTKEPTLLVLDEPMNHLDESSQKEVVLLIQDWIQGGPRRAAIIVSHEEISKLNCTILSLHAARPGSSLAEASR